MTIASRMRSLPTVLALLAALGVFDVARAAAPQAIEDVRFVKQNGVARAEIQFACAVRYLSHTPESGRDLQIRIALEPDCARELGTGVRSELVEPPPGNLAGVRQIVFDTTGEERVAWVALDAGRVVRFAVSQGAMRNVLRVEIVQPDAAPGSSDLVPDASVPPTTTMAPPATTTAPPGMTASPPAALAQAAPRTPPAPGASGSAPASSGPQSIDSAVAPLPERRPLRLVQPAAARVERYVLQLAAGPNAAAAAESLVTSATETLYVNERSAGERSWQELRLGFFDTEATARARLDSLRARFPDSVIAVAGIAEQDAARERRLHPDTEAVRVATAELERAARPLHRAPRRARRRGE